MGPVLIAFLIAVSATAWIYSKFMRNTGNLTQRAVMAAGISGLVIFFAAWVILGFIF
jgi:hypothetical protein